MSDFTGAAFTGWARRPAGGIRVTEPHAAVLERLRQLHARFDWDRPVRVVLFPSVRPGVAYALPAERTVVVGRELFAAVRDAVALLPEDEQARWTLED